MKMPKEVTEALEATGKPWQIIHRATNKAIYLNGEFMGAVNLNRNNGKAKNSHRDILAKIKRHMPQKEA